MLVYPWNKWQLGLKLRKSFCCLVKLQSERLISNGFPNYIVDERIKHKIKNVNQQNKHCTTPPSQQTYIKLFYCNQIHYNYKSDEKY